MFKPSKFNFFYSRSNNENIVYNTFSKALISLDDEHATALKNNSYNIVFSDEEIEFLINNGFLVEEKNSMQLAEAISQILSDDKIIERFKEKGFETIKKYDYREISKQYKNLYERALFKK